MWRLMISISVVQGQNYIWVGSISYLKVLDWVFQLNKWLLDLGMTIYLQVTRKREQIQSLE